MSKLYDNIASECAKRGITIYKLSKDIGIKNSVLSDLKNGRTKNLRSDTLEKISTYLGVSPAALLGIEEYMPEAELDEYRQLLVDRPEMKTLFHTAKRATKEQIEAIVKMMEAMKGDNSD